MLKKPKRFHSIKELSDFIYSQPTPIKTSLGLANCIKELDIRLEYIEKTLGGGISDKELKEKLEELDFSE